MTLIAIRGSPSPVLATCHPAAAVLTSSGTRSQEARRWTGSRLPSWRGAAWPGAGPAQPQPDRSRAGQVPLRLRPLCRARCCGSGPATASMAETHDAFDGAIKTEAGPAVGRCSTCRSSTRRTARSRSRAREKGDVLAVHIHSIVPRGPQPVGTTGADPGVRRPRRHAAAPRCSTRRCPSGSRRWR